MSPEPPAVEIGRCIEHLGQSCALGLGERHGGHPSNDETAAPKTIVFGVFPSYREGFRVRSSHGAHERLIYCRCMSEHGTRSEGLNVGRPSVPSDPVAYRHRSSAFEPGHDAPSATAANADRAEPEPATRAERVVAITTTAAVALLTVGAIGHLFLLGSGLVPFNAGEWGLPDYSYLMLMALISVALIVHSALPEHARRPRTIIVLSSTIGGVGTLLALAKGWLMSFGAAFAEEDWIAYSVLGATAVSILPFALPLTAGIILLRNDFKPREWRVRAVAIAITVAATVILIAALVPRWVGFV